MDPFVLSIACNFSNGGRLRSHSL